MPGQKFSIRLSIPSPSLALHFFPCVDNATGLSLTLLDGLLVLLALHLLNSNPLYSDPLISDLCPSALCPLISELCFGLQLYVPTLCSLSCRPLKHTDQGGLGAGLVR